ncbi:hypothetical protein EV426DRAFT_686441 [Tirmania nivea]|nr:hypothetical protein EV426DRAFT_686441 [Tirmania nivea]
MSFFSQPVHVLFVAAFAATQATAHLSIWHPAMFGSDPDNINSDNASKPHVDRDFKGWWFHDNLDKPPKDPNTVVFSSRWWRGQARNFQQQSTYQYGDRVVAQPRGSTRTVDKYRKWLGKYVIAKFAGSALAIAYKSNAADVTPDDFVVFSVAHDSPARQLQAYPVPAGLPPCPNNKCICAWFWIHDSRGGDDEMYMTGFQCNVTGATDSGRQIGKPKAPQRCDGDGWDNAVKAQKGKCIVGAKGPMYWKNKEHMNMVEPRHWAPTYSDKYGYKDGAQNDIFEDGRIDDGSAGTPRPTQVSATCNCEATPKPTPSPVAPRACDAKEAATVTETLTVSVVKNR